MEPRNVVPLMRQDKKRFSLFLINICVYEALQTIACSMVVSVYSDDNKFHSCGIDNYRTPKDAAAVFDRPLLLLAIYHMIEWVRTLILLVTLLGGSAVYYLMYGWYFTLFNTIFGGIVILRVSSLLISAEGK